MMNNTDIDEDRMSGDENRLNDMDEDMNGGNGVGPDSPLKPSHSMDSGEDILSKLKQQVSMAHGLDSAASPPPTLSPGLHNPFMNNHQQADIYNRLQNILNAKMKREDEESNMMSMDDHHLMRAEALQRQRESMMTSPQALLANAVRSGVPHPLLGSGTPFGMLPGTVGLPPTTQLPPTPGSAGSRDSSGNGSRTPSHTPEPPQQTWSFDDQYKPNQEPSKHSSFEEDKRKLYDISDDPKRREFLDNLFSFMQQKGNPINRLPIMAKQVLDLYELYNLVVSRGGLVDVINKKLWQEIIKGLKLPSSITSAAFTLRTQYMKYIYPYECEKNKLSDPRELQVAIDGNRREGRRSSYAAGYGDNPSNSLLNFQNMQHFAGLPRLHAPLSLVSRPQMNGNGVHGHSMVPHDLLRGGGSPPSSTSAAFVDVARLNLLKMYGQHMGGNAPLSMGPMGNSMSAGMPLSSNEEEMRMNSQIPLMPPHPPQREALNLDVKDEFDMPIRLNKKDSPPSSGGDDESNGLPPPSKRLHSDDEMRDSSGSDNTPVTTQSSKSNINNISIFAQGETSRIGISQPSADDQRVSINMEINGMQYKGFLYPEQQQQTSSPSRSHSNPLINSHILPQLSASPLMSSPASPLGISCSRFR